MTNQEVYNYIKKHVDDHVNKDGNEYLADFYVKKGYGQVKGGYFEEAYILEKKIYKPEAEPSQKWHLIVPYYDYKIEKQQINMQEKANLGRIVCPQLMLWIAEIAGLNQNILKSAMEHAIKYEKDNKTKDSRKIKNMVLKKELHWTEIINCIKNADTWEDVVTRIDSI